MLPRHSRARALKASRLKAPTAPEPRPRLNEEDTQQLTTVIREKFKIEPRDFQVEAVKAQIEGVDMILQASTGAGKTMVAAGPHLWPGNQNKFTIMTCPLLSLEEEMVGFNVCLCIAFLIYLILGLQVQTFETDYGLRAIALNSKNGACEPKKLNVSPTSQSLAILLDRNLIPSMRRQGHPRSEVPDHPDLTRDAPIPNVCRPNPSQLVVHAQYDFHVY